MVRSNRCIKKWLLMSLAAKNLPSGLKASADAERLEFGSVIKWTLLAVLASHTKIIGSTPAYPVATNFLSSDIVRETISSECP